MQTCLDIYCDFKGWQGGTIHQAQEDFAQLSFEERNEVCDRLMSSYHSGDLSDLNQLLWFSDKRLELGYNTKTLGS